MRFDNTSLLRRVRDKVQSTHTLAVQAHHLSKTETDSQLHAVGCKVPDCPGVSIEVSRCEAKVRCVKKREKLLRLHNGADLRPLVLGGVATTWIVSGCMKDEDVACFGTLESVQERLEVESTGRVKILVSLDWEADRLEYCSMVAPSWIGDVDRGARSANSAKKGSCEMERSSSRKCLRSRNL